MGRPASRAHGQGPPDAGRSSQPGTDLPLLVHGGNGAGAAIARDARGKCLRYWSERHASQEAQRHAAGCGEGDDQPGGRLPGREQNEPDQGESEVAGAEDGARPYRVVQRRAE